MSFAGYPDLVTVGGMRSVEEIKNVSFPSIEQDLLNPSQGSKDTVAKYRTGVCFTLYYTTS